MKEAIRNYELKRRGVRCHLRYANRKIYGRCVLKGPGDVDPDWGRVVVYPNVGATVLAEVFIIGEAVTDGSVVGRLWVMS